MSTKVCNVCGVEYDLNKFHKDSSKKDGLYKSCKICANSKAKAYREANPFKVKAKNKAYREANHADPLKARDRHLRHKFGITYDHYLEILEAQNGRCAICGTNVPSGKGAFHVDHCHDSGKIRGLLCHHCNVGLGHFKDSVSYLSSAIHYLSTYHDHKASSD